MLDFFGIIRQSMRYWTLQGEGKTVSVYVWKDDLDLLTLQFERKIEPKDVENGKLKSVVLQETKRRGGKRLTTIALSFESAEALHNTLGRALKDARRRRFGQGLINNIFAFLLFRYRQTT